MELIWQCKALEFRDLPTVRELLGEADEKMLATELVEMLARGGYPELKGTQAKRARKRAREAIREMRSLEPRRPSRKHVFMPITSYDLESVSGAITVGTVSVLVSRADIMAAAAGELEGHIVGASPLFEPWRKVLAYRVWLPEGFSRRERYKALADILGEMTYFGWSEKSASKRRKKARKKLERAAADADRSGTRLIPAELAHREFGLEASTDDYDAEYEERLWHIACALNHGESDDFDARAADLGKRLRLGKRR